MRFLIYRGYMVAFTGTACAMGEMHYHQTSKGRKTFFLIEESALRSAQYATKSILRPSPPQTVYFHFANQVYSTGSGGKSEGFIWVDWKTKSNLSTSIGRWQILRDQFTNWKGKQSGIWTSFRLSCLPPPQGAPSGQKIIARSYFGQH